MFHRRFYVPEDTKIGRKSDYHWDNEVFFSEDRDIVPLEQIHSIVSVDYVVNSETNSMRFLFASENIS